MNPLMSISLQQLVINQAKINKSPLLWSYISSALFLFCLSYIHALKLNYKGNQKASSTETLSLAHRFFFFSYADIFGEKLVKYK